MSYMLKKGITLRTKVFYPIQLDYDPK